MNSKQQTTKEEQVVNASILSITTMAGKTDEPRIPLLEWISSFETFLMTVSSADYMIKTLRLTSAIADEICKVIKETGRSPTLASIGYIVFQFTQSQIII